ncbi:MAG TPA: SRPBCC family protein [Burkholderiaceae bacterium]|nr:SRPBCC family protein [Burkholderiaceae bacterium]
MTPMLLIGAALGGAAIYLLDPNNGRRRRALIRDQATRMRRRGGRVIEAGVRDLAHRGAAIPHQVGSMLSREQVSDEKLVQRVRAKMGRYVGHPGAIEVSASEGRVTLRGDLLVHERDALVSALRKVSGVTEIDDQLTAHASAEGVPQLQGSGRRAGERTELMQDNWAPSTRIVTGTAATGLALYALAGHGIGRIAAAAAGSALLARTVANKPLRVIAGMAGRRGIDIDKTIEIAAPVDTVYQFLANPENFPEFMRNVRRVTRGSGEQSHWVVAGPAGTSVEWDSELTRQVPNEHLAWRTVPGSLVEHAGMIDFESTERGSRVRIRMTYNPPAGALGHVAATLFGANPKKELDEDLMRLKSRIQTGKSPRDAASAHSIEPSPESGLPWHAAQPQTGSGAQASH